MDINIVLFLACAPLWLLAAIAAGFLSLGIVVASEAKQSRRSTELLFASSLRSSQ
ncbi:MAG TPA: hypothetical protein VKV77_01870 [Methylovirgula sp.]|nr:hypothetical protein [Methylovirgula sp.]